MYSSIDSIILNLQAIGVLPYGQYKYNSWEQQFSFIFRVTINGRVFFFKKLKPRAGFSDQDIAGKLNGEYEALTKYARYFKEEKHFNVPRPVYHSIENLLLITEEIKGTSIADIGKRYASRRSSGDNIAVDVYCRAGRFIKVLHESETYPYTAHDLDELANYIRERLFRGVFNKSEEASISGYLKETCSAINDSIEKYNKNPVHHDLDPNNILSLGKDISLLDFGEFRLDNRFQDLVYFKLMLERQLESWIKYRPSAIRDIMGAFSEGYGCDYNIISKDKLYDLYVLKNYAIFITTFAHKKKWRLPFQLSLKSIKDKILNSMEYEKIKKRILLIVTGNL